MNTIDKQRCVGYTDDPLWGLCSVIKSEWANGKVTWTIRGNKQLLSDEGLITVLRVRRDVDQCPPLTRVQE